jgi:transposase
MVIQHSSSLSIERSLRHTRNLRIIQDYSAGRKCESIAAFYGTSIHTVLRIARSAGLAKRERRNQERASGILLAYKEGLSVKEIAKQFQCSIALVSSLASEHGICRR